MRRILLGLILLILYGSLYPWHFARMPGKAVLAWPQPLDRGDVLVNVLLYIPLGACAYFALSSRRRVRFVAPVALALLLSVSIELLQVFEPLRSSQLSDVVTNMIGGAMGMLLAAFLPLQPSAESFLLICWSAHLLFLGSPWWPTELIGWGIVASVALPERSFRWRGPVALACYMAILLRGLAPFRFVPGASRFDWVPFEGFILANWEQMIPVFVAKVFWYGAAVWVLWRVRVSWIVAGVAAACFLAAIEVAQQHIPPHVPEITDPLLALLLAATFAAVPSPRREVGARC